MGLRTYLARTRAWKWAGPKWAEPALGAGLNGIAALAVLHSWCRRYLQALQFSTLVLLVGLSVRLPMFGDDGIRLEIMASRVSTVNGEFTGHAFMCLELLLNSGIKEDCYGFYPKNDNIKGFVGGPGAVNSEFKKNPSRFSRIDQSLKVPISDVQRRTILGLVNDWDSKNYDLTKEQCVDFIRAVAQAAGLKVPPRDTLDFPVDLVAKLKKLNP
jgi:hypothetical protein